MIVAGEDITDWPEKRLVEIRRRVTMVFQSGALFDSLTVGENIAFPLADRTGRQRRNRSTRAWPNWRRCSKSPNSLDKLPSELSTGTKRAVAIARALAQDPEAILYDEPTTMVDPLMAAHTGDLILKLKEKFHKTSVVVTHDTHLAKKLADRLVFLQEGRVAFFGPWSEFESSRDPFLRNFRLQDELIPAAGRHAVSDRSHERLRAASEPTTSRKLPRVMGFWDVLLFNIADGAGPALDCRGGAQRRFLDQPVDHRGGRYFLCPRRW